MSKMSQFKRSVASTSWVAAVRTAYNNKRFEGSAPYWEQRYRNGSNSGAGSYGNLASYKAEVLNQFVAENGIESVIEFGCGDGNQLLSAEYPHYLGFDVSEAAVKMCADRFDGDAGKEFRLMSEYAGEVAEVSLSLDVIYHLVEDHVFDEYMQTLFAAASRFVIIYSSDTNSQAAIQPPHVRHREFSDWIGRNATTSRLVNRIPNRYPIEASESDGSFADFFIYEVNQNGSR